jgi:hypothetical protein
VNIWNKHKLVIKVFIVVFVLKLVHLLVFWNSVNIDSSPSLSVLHEVAILIGLVNAHLFIPVLEPLFTIGYTGVLLPLLFLAVLVYIGKLFEQRSRVVSIVLYAVGFYVPLTLLTVAYALYSIYSNVNF